MRLPLDADVLLAQRDSLRDALRKVLGTREAEARARMTYETARDNYSGGAKKESDQYLRAMDAASQAENEALTLLLTLKA